MKVEVAYGEPAEQILLEIEVPAGATARQAIEQSGLLRDRPQLAGLPSGVGVFSRAVDPDYVLSAGDRVEIYRPLLVDPKESRRRRAAARKAKAETE